MVETPRKLWSYANATADRSPGTPTPFWLADWRSHLPLRGSPFDVLEREYMSLVIVSNLLS
jgi:hypothetical protein